MHGGVVVRVLQTLTLTGCQMASISNMNSDKDPQSRMSQEGAAHTIQIPNWLQTLKWKYRILLLAGAHADAVMKHFVDNTDDVVDRNLLLVDLDSGKTYPAIQSEPELAQTTTSHAIGSQEQKYCAVLIGKDGKIKQTYTHAPSCSEVFGLIDTMPMRIDEMH
jgi:hypothetical protein